MTDPAASFRRVEPQRVVVGLGANLGDRLASLRDAKDRLADAPSIELLGVSHVYETPPLPTAIDQPDFLNAALLVRASLALPDLLALTLSVERAMGRIRRQRWGPRSIDLDLLHADAPITTAALTVPHPGLRQRPFALQPLLDVWPDAIDPDTQRPYRDLAAATEPITRLDVTL